MFTSLMSPRPSLLKRASQIQFPVSGLKLTLWLTKVYDRELAKLKKAKERVAKKVSKSTKAKPASRLPARAKAKTAAKPSARKSTAKKITAPKKAKPAAKKTVKAKAKTAGNR